MEVKRLDRDDIKILLPCGHEVTLDNLDIQSQIFWNDSSFSSESYVSHLKHVLEVDCYDCNTTWAEEG